MESISGLTTDVKKVLALQKKLYRYKLRWFIAFHQEGSELNRLDDE